jgi:hypothetical protein
MRWAALLAVGIISTAVAARADMNEVRLPAGDPVVAPDSGGGSTPHAARGQLLGLSCSNVEKAGDGVSVVLFPNNNDDPTGITGVLATDQNVEPGLVHVRVPDFPELSDHTLRVKAFYRDAGGAHVCDGGNVKIN